jgi:hypothetical protein
VPPNYEIVIERAASRHAEKASAKNPAPPPGTPRAVIAPRL